MPRALLSVSDKTGIVDLGRGLAARGFELVSTGGTARALTDAGLAGHQRLRRHRLSRDDGRPRQDAAPDDARRHPRAARSSRRSRGRRARTASASSTSSSSTCIRSWRRRAKPGVTFDELVEQIDIGGPSMVRAAAKNFRDVLVVVDPGRLRAAADGSSTPGGPTLAFRFELMRKAFAHTGAYDTAIAATLAAVDVDGDRFDAASRIAPRRSRRSRRSAAREDPRSALRREPASEGGVVSRVDGAAQRLRRADDPAGQGAVVHEPARPRRGGAHRRSSSTSRPRS